MVYLHQGGCIKMLIINKKDLKIIGQKIKDARNSKKIEGEKEYTQEGVSEKVGLSPDQYRNIENGRSLGSVQALLNICNLLEITPNDLFYELLKKKEEVLDKKLYGEFQDLTLKEKELIRTLMVHIKKNR